jgi:hypothetical protein
MTTTPTTRPGPAASPAQPPRRPSRAARWGTWVARRRWWVLSVWAVVLVAAVLAYPHLLRSLTAADYSVTGSDSARVAELIHAGARNPPCSGPLSAQDLTAVDRMTTALSEPVHANRQEALPAPLLGARRGLMGSFSWSSATWDQAAGARSTGRIPGPAGTAVIGPCRSAVRERRPYSVYMS